jgi:hypothetical protein
VNILFLLMLAYLFGGESKTAPTQQAPAPAPVPPPFPSPQPLPPVLPGPFGVPAPPAQPPAAAKTYVIQSGDSASAIAKKFTGNGGRWRELLPPNPNLKVVQTRDESGTIMSTHVVPFNAGQVLNVPASWPALPA